MNQRKRLSICYAAPGLNFVPSAGPTRNVLNLANALSQWADVTVAFRSIPRESLSNGKYKVIAIEPQIRRRTRSKTTTQHEASTHFVIGRIAAHSGVFPNSRRASMMSFSRRDGAFPGIC
jgi:hypothetical protein